MKLTFAMAAAVTVAAAAASTLAAQEVIKSQWDGVYTKAQAERGELLYGRQCSSCHGADLTGGGSEDASALIGSGFTPDWDHKSLGELFERIRTTMPQFDAGSLSRHQTADILAFMLYKGGYPAGAAELPVEAETLRIYTFLAVKPKVSSAFIAKRGVRFLARAVER